LTLSPRYDYANTTKTQSVITNGSRQSSVEHWRQAQISDERAKLILYAAFVDGKVKAPKSLLQEVHRLYFEPQYEEFSGRTMWSLSQRIHQRLQEAGSHPAIQGHGQTGRISQSTAGIVKVGPRSGVAITLSGSGLFRVRRPVG
jgi:hypothetical protein